jgi:hypothetical protein
VVNCVGGSSSGGVSISDYGLLCTHRCGLYALAWPENWMQSLLVSTMFMSIDNSPIRYNIILYF